MKRIIGMILELTFLGLILGPIGVGIWFACYAIWFVILVLDCHAKRIENITRNIDR